MVWIREKRTIVEYEICYGGDCVVAERDPKLDELLRDRNAAEDSGFYNLVINAHADIEEHLWREGCPSPGLALLACLLLQPLLIEQVAAVLPKPSVFEDKTEQRVYAALLADPGLAFGFQWVALAEKAEVASAFMFNLVAYEHANIMQAGLYVQLLFMAAVQRELMKLAELLARASVFGHNILNAIEQTERRLEGLRARLAMVTASTTAVTAPEFERPPYQKRELKKLVVLGETNDRKDKFFM